MALENLEPVTREEALLDQIAVGDSELTDGPVTRHEWFMTAIAAAKAGSPVAGEDALDPVTREEYFLKKIAESFSGGGGVEMESGKYEPASDIVHPTITFANSHDRSPDFYFIIDTKTDGETTPAASTNLWMVYVCWENIVDPVYEGADPIYGFYNGVYWYSGSATNQSRRFKHTTSEEPVGADSVFYPKYFATSSSIKPYVADTRKFKSTQSYDWYAYWL